MRPTNSDLDPEKLRVLQRLAACEDGGVSDLFREAVDQLIEGRYKERSFEEVLRAIDAARPTDISQEEIERDIAEAIAEVRAERALRRAESAAKGPKI